ncbi:MAG: carboxypeptidase regulatory-like domain-containing protein [Terriglobales bacterium]
MHSPLNGIRVLGIVCLLLAISVPTFSQTTMGRILGSVSDQSGAAVAGATVVVTDVQRGSTRTVATDASGDYTAPELQPGVYKVRVEAKGFKTVERVNILVEVAADLRVDVSLPPGEVSETVVVTDEVPLVNITSSTLGGTLSNKEINDLPLNGRNYENLLQLRPGIVRYPGGGFSTTSSNGLRAEDNAYLVDGLFNSEPFSGQSIINGAGIAGDSATILPIDAIQEFNLQQNPSAEYGWKPGSIVNVGLKSGTNQIHGSAYAFGRDTPLDARNYFNTDASGAKNPRNLEQFGGTAGGALIKDKLFYFGAYEGQRYTVGNTSLLNTWATVPLASAGNCFFTGTGDCANSIPDAIADVHAAFLAGAIPADVSQVSLQVAGCTFTPPSTVSCNGKGFPANNGTNPAGPAFINYGLPNTVNTDNAVGKVDYQRSQRHSFSSLYFFGDNSGTVSDASEVQPQWLTQIHTRAQVFGENWTFVPNSNWVNEARFGYNRLYQPTFTNDHNVLASSYGLNTGVTNTLYGGLPRINIFPDYIFPQELGGFNWPKVQGPDTRIQFIDHVSYIRGKHAIKFGGELHRDGFTGGAYGGVRGRIKFGFGGFDAFASACPPADSPCAQGIEDFFAGAPNSGSQLVGDPTRHIHNWGYAGFLQDDWRVGKTFTLNVGLRYELNTVIKEEHNLLGNFSPTAGLEQVGMQIKAPYNGDHKDFAPRIGFAWDITGNGRTVVRGGFGMMYETLNWESFLALENSMGLSTIPTGAIINASGGTAGGTIAVGTVNFSSTDLDWDPAVTGVPGTVFPTTAINCYANPCSIMGIDTNLKTPYVLNWTLNVQHSFTPNLSLELGYVGDHGSRLAGIRDINQVDPNSAAEIACGHCEQNGRPFFGQLPYLAQVYQMGNIYRSNYDALQATLTSRNYHGLSMVAGYTYSHALDMVGANWDFGEGNGLPTDSTHYQREYASSDFDMRHRLTVSLTYLIPGREGAWQMMKGWQINSIITLNGAQPWGVMDTGDDISQTGEAVDRWDFSGNPKSFKPTPTGIPFFAGTGVATAPTSNSACNSAALAVDGGVAGGPTSTELATLGCYAVGSASIIPPALGTEGTMGRNIFRDTGFRNADLSLAKNFKWRERFGAQFRVEFFNIFNHPNFANPFGGQNGWGHNDPSGGAGVFGCSCATPDVAASNPVIGSGGSRATQLGLKLTF